MNYKKTFLIFTVFISCLGFSQNKQLLYGFAEMPHTLMVNPGAETNFKFHAGVPLLSGNSFFIGSSGVTTSDLFIDDGISFNTKLENLMGKLTERDFLSSNIQIEVLNGGYRLNNKTYLSFGLYQELDFIAYYPKDIVELAYYGNVANINVLTHLSQLKYRAEFLGVLHAGISYKMDEKLNIGGRLKLYSGSLYAASNNNSGTFTTTLDQVNYQFILNNLNVNAYSSGFFNKDDSSNIDNVSIDVGDIIGNTILSKNIGVGVDVGFTYHYSPQIEFSGSVLDVGFVSYSKNIRNLTAKGDYQFNGLEILSDNIDYYVDQIEDDFQENVTIETNQESFVTWRPIKLNASVKYSFGMPRRVGCYGETLKEYYNNAVGLQLYSITRPLSTQVAATLFLEKSIGQKFHTKFTYTIDDYSFTNVGVGVSTQLGVFHVYGLVDNILKYSNLKTANSASLQFGFNLIFN